MKYSKYQSISELQSVMFEYNIDKVDTTSLINNTITSLSEVKERMGSPPWCVRIIYNDFVSGVMICQMPGEGSTMHFHPDSDEWWVVMEGELMWYIESTGKIKTKAGDIVFVEKGRKHRVECIGFQPAIRLAVSSPDVEHICVES